MGALSWVDVGGCSVLDVGGCSVLGVGKKTCCVWDGLFEGVLTCTSLNVFVMKMSVMAATCCVWDG